MSTDAPHPDRIRFTVPQRQRAKALPFIAIYTVVGIAYAQLPPDSIPAQSAYTALYLTAGPLLFLAYLIFGRGYVEIDAQGVEFGFLGFFRRSISWAEVDDIAIEQRLTKNDVGNGKSVVLLLRDGKRRRLPTPGVLPVDSGEGTFAPDVRRLVHFWQRQTGRPLAAPITLRRRYHPSGTWDEEVVQPGGQ